MLARIIGVADAYDAMTCTALTVKRFRVGSLACALRRR